MYLCNTNVILLHTDQRPVLMYSDVQSGYMWSVAVWSDVQSGYMWSVAVWSDVQIGYMWCVVVWSDVQSGYMWCVAVWSDVQSGYMWCVVVWSDVPSGYMWWIVIQNGEGWYSWHSGLFVSKLHLLVFLIIYRNPINAKNMEYIRPIHTIFLTISNHFPTHSFERYSNKNITSYKTTHSSKSVQLLRRTIHKIEIKMLVGRDEFKIFNVTSKINNTVENS